MRLPSRGFYALILLFSGSVSTAQAALTESEQAVASALRPVCGNLEVAAGGVGADVGAFFGANSATNDLYRRCADALNLFENSGEDAAKNALTNIASEESAAQGSSSAEISSVQNSNITSRIATLHGVITGGSAGMIASKQPASAMQFAALDSFDWRTAVAAVDSDASAGSFSSSIVGTGKLGMFINGSYRFGDHANTSREAGFDIGSYGITAGADYRVQPDMFIGSAVGYTTLNYDLNGSRGSLDADAVNVSLFGTYFTSDSLYVDGIVTYARNKFESRRNLNFDLPETTGSCTCGTPLAATLTGNTISINQQALGGVTGTEFSVALDTGFEHRVGALLINPEFSINYTKAKIPSFSETMSDSNSAGKGLMLRYGSQDINSLISGVGSSFSFASSTKRGIVTPQVGVVWLHEFQNDSRTIDTNYLLDPGSQSSVQNMNVVTDNPDRDYFSLNLSVSLLSKNGMVAYAAYESLLGLKDITLNTVNVGFRAEY